MARPADEQHPKPARVDPSDVEARSKFFERAKGQTDYLCAALAQGRLLVKTEDTHVGRSLFVKGGRGDIDVLDRTVSTIRALFGDDAIEGRTFIDVGANIGSTTVSAMLAHGFADALALEPEPDNFLTLRLNMILNDIDDRVTVMPVAASNVMGNLDLVVNRERSGKHFIARLDAVVRRSQGAVTSVPVVTLDALAANATFDPDRVGLLWIDAENHEPEILEGASELVSRGVPVLMEWDPAGLRARGDPHMLADLVGEHYTHIAKMRPEVVDGQRVLELNSAASIGQMAESQEHFTDILLLRLSDDQVPTEGLIELIRSLRPPAADTSVRSLSDGLGAANRWLRSTARDIAPRLRRRGD